MVIERLQLRNFRTYQALDFQPHRALNVFLGDNAQGKTNLLESIVFCAIGKSHRTARDIEMIAFGQESAKIQLDLEKRDFHTRIKIMQGQRKQITIDDKNISKISDLMGSINIVLFSPEDLRLVKDTPMQRRRFMDMELSQMHRGYFLALQKYMRALAQRNTLLRTKATAAMIAAFDEPLCQAAGEIIEHRKIFMQSLGQIAQKTHYDISSFRENLEVYYSTCVESDKAQEIRENLHERLIMSQKKDICLGTTSIGPHRDDILLKLDGKDVRAFGSQGQQRTVALSLKLSEIALMERIMGEKPLLLLDDVMSELDIHRSGQLLSYLQNIQTFLTCTHINEKKLKEAAYYRVKDGALIIQE